MTTKEAKGAAAQQQADAGERKIQIGPHVFYEKHIVAVELLLSGEAIVHTVAGQFRFQGEQALDITRFWSVPTPGGDLPAPDAMKGRHKK